VQNDDYGVTQAGVRAGENASQFGARTSQIDEGAAGVAKGVEHVAEGVRAGVESSVQYFREHGFKDVVDDLTAYVKSHPTQALIGAAALGFIAGRLLRRS
jgi:ElaB/YqjD/DUF883 family membrane-anchored ribosome-binding protein